MEKLIKITSTCVPLNIENVDTDQIIPARFLKATDKKGFGENLFRDWRYDKNMQPIPDFPLNQKQYAGSILVAGKNFGSGSSREHAAWALGDYGFKVVISSYFADIFKNNALNNGILPVQISEKLLEVIFEKISQNPKLELEVDLPLQKMSIPFFGLYEFFEIDSYKKQCLLEGLDDIDYLLNSKNEIEAFEIKHVDYTANQIA
jgi:3-isopropylmalate/(R)-2-methylmalate dehydratase small subunit